MAVIMSNASHTENFPFIKFIREQNHSPEYVSIVLYVTHGHVFQYFKDWIVSIKKPYLS